MEDRGQLFISRFAVNVFYGQRFDSQKGHSIYKLF